MSAAITTGTDLTITESIPSLQDKGPSSKAAEVGLTLAPPNATASQTVHQVPRPAPTSNANPSLDVAPVLSAIREGTGAGLNLLDNPPDLRDRDGFRNLSLPEIRPSNPFANPPNVRNRIDLRDLDLGIPRQDMGLTTPKPNS